MHGPTRYRILNGLRQGVAAACDRWPVVGDTPHCWAAATDGVVISILIGLKQLAAAWPKEERFANIRDLLGCWNV